MALVPALFALAVAQSASPTAAVPFRIAENAIILDRGAIVFCGPSGDLLAAPDRLEQLMGVTARGTR